MAAPMTTDCLRMSHQPSVIKCLSNFLASFCLLLFLYLISQSNARPSPSVSSDTTSAKTSAIEELHRLLNFRNGSSYSPLVPASPEQLLVLNSEQLESDGLGISPALPEPLAGHSASRKMRKHRHRMDANTPFTHRAICPFQFVLNHRPNRVPSTLVEVKCLSPNPSQRLLGRPLPLVECEPFRWTMRVLECQEDGQCQHSEERIALACVPVMQANKEKTDTEAPTAVVDVPADPVNETFMPT